MEHAISRERSNSLPSLQASLAPLRDVAYKSELIAGYVRQQPYSDRMLEIDKAAKAPAMITRSRSRTLTE